ncbi:MAG: S8 family serine peptidase [Chthonomonas sp.]|nr:S8 family serine peptidase [Chthonomonas sp.]
MKKLVLVAAATLALSVGALAGVASGEKDPAAPRYAPGKLMVKYAPGMLQQARVNNLQIAQELSIAVPGATFRNQLGKSDWALWTYDERIDPLVAARLMAKQEGVIFCEPSHEVRALLTTPNDGDWGATEDDEECYLILDPDEQFDPFNRLWALDDVQAFTGWTHWPNQWYTAANKPQDAPLIAVIDSGADMNHPDFINAGGSTSNVTGGGQINHALSHRFRFGTIDTANPDPDDENGHGTHVLGTALAAGNNGSFNGHGHIGTGYGCQGMVLNVIEGNGSGNDADVAAAMYYAADQGADVINLSLGTQSFAYSLQDAVTYCLQKGTLVVAACNESGSPSGTLPPIYPAACSGAFAVTAAGPLGNVPTSYTTAGEYFDMAAPGGDLAADSYANFLLVFVWSTMPRGEFALQSQTYIPTIKNDYSQIIGTSMATPHVSGAAGMWLGKAGLRQTSGFTSFRTMNELHRTALTDTFANPNGTWDAGMGFGFLDMEALLGGNATKTPVGGTMEGIVYSNGIAASNAQVVARKGAATISTTADTRGQYRFALLQPGTWTVTATTQNGTKVRKVEVVAGQETPGVDFRAGTSYDTTAPVLARLQLASAPSASTVTLRHWALDTETGVDKLIVRIGTTPGASNTKADTELTWTGDTFAVTGLSLSAGTTYYLRATYTNGANLSTARIIPFTTGGTMRTVSGTVTLNNWLKTRNQRLGWAEFRNPTTGAVLAQHPLIIDRLGRYTIQTNLAGNLDIAIKTSHWLSKRRNIGTTSNAVNQNVSLTNGDCNEDNIVDIADYSILATAFDSQPDSPNWDERADLNGDDIVDIADYNLLASAFDLAGE